MHSAEKLNFFRFDLESFLADYSSFNQVDYLKSYLNDLNAETILEESNYFDRDYLDEFSSFYGRSVEGYSNICKRLHIFKEPGVTRDLFEEAVGGNANSLSSVEERYLGFIVIRPIKSAPLGKTVLAWYPEKTPKNPRVVEPSRDYNIDLCGIELKIKGLAWQQQDRGVAACATIALWSMLQSSALDEYYFIPTTSEITEAANKTASFGNRVYPSKGLSSPQICEALKELGLAPCIMLGDVYYNNGKMGFSRRRFANTCAAFIRSGYPILLAGDSITQGQAPRGHAICAVGFRENPLHPLEKGMVLPYDESIQHLYIHDDNIGPSVRFGIFSDNQSNIAYIKPDRPRSVTGTDPIDRYGHFIPHAILAAVNPELRTDPDELYITGFKIARSASLVLSKTLFPTGLNFSTRFIKKRDYLKNELNKLLGGQIDLLAKTRLRLVEEARPMSKHIVLVRIGSGPHPIFDILFDTSDSYLKAFATVSYWPNCDELVKIVSISLRIDLGKHIQAV